MKQLPNLPKLAKEGIKRPNFSVSALSSRAQGALYLNLALLLLIGIIWWLILKPDQEPEIAPATTTLTTQEADPTPAPTPGPTTPQPAGETYTVASGDTLAGIGTKLGVEWQRIADANGIKEPFALQVGQVLKIPR